MNQSKPQMYNVTRRRLLAATTVASLSSLAGCSSDDAVAEAETPDRREETPEDAPEKETGASTPEPEPEPELPPEVNDLYTRAEYGVDELNCGQIKPYTRVIPDGVYVVVVAGRWAEQKCEQFTFVNEKYDEDTSTVKLYVDWGVNGNEGCEAECARGKVLLAAYDLDYEVKGVELYLAENGDEAKLAESWNR